MAPIVDGIDQRVAGALNEEKGNAKSVVIASLGLDNESAHGTTGAKRSETSEHDIEEEQPGALQQIMTRKQQIYTYALIWIVVFVLQFSKGIFDTLTPYVTSSFQRHSFTAITGVVASIVSGVTRLPYAKLLDVWGRPQSMSVMVFLTVLGSVMMAGCNDLATYSAAQVFYYVGYYGIQFSLVIFISDSAPMDNRGLLFGIVWSSSLVSIWAYGPAAQRILDGAGFRWGFGVGAISITFFCAPMLFVMFKLDRAARNAGIITRPRSNRTLKESIIFYLKEFDIIGLLILATGLSLLLLSLSLYSYQSEDWRSPMIICFVIFGPLLVAAFVLYEIYLAPKTFLPWKLLKNRTVINTNLMAATLYTSAFMQSAYIYSMLIVVFDQSITHATYITNIYSFGASFWGILIGVAFRYYGRIKIYALVLGIPFFILGQGLMIMFKPSFTPIGLMVGCEILISFGGGTMYPIEQMTLMGASQKHTPALLATEAVIIDIGKGAGAAIAAAIWTGMFKNKLAKYLPTNDQAQLTQIYGSIDVQSSFEPGTPSRLAINHAYLDTQRVIFIIATSLLAVTWVSVLFWEDIDVKSKRLKTGKSSEALPQSAESGNMSILPKH